MAQERAPLEYNRTWQMRLWLFGVFFFLYAPLVALVAFSVYQLYRFSYTHAFGLIALTLFDLLVIALIWHEWQVQRRWRAPS